MFEYIINFTDQKWHKTIYTYSAYISIILYIISLAGLTIIAPQKLSYLRNLLKIYISIILILRFNPFIIPKYNEANFLFDRKLAFSAGIFLLLTTSLTEYVEKMINI
jgi:hypothetical protein